MYFSFSVSVNVYRYQKDILIRIFIIVRLSLSSLVSVDRASNLWSVKGVFEIFLIELNSKFLSSLCT